MLVARGFFENGSNSDCLHDRTGQAYPAGMTKCTLPATKDDLLDLERRGDGKLQGLEDRMDGKLQGLEQRFDAKLDALETRIMYRFELLTENLVSEFRAGSRDKSAVHDDQIQDCRTRLTRLEKHAGIGGV